MFRIDRSRVNISSPQGVEIKPEAPAAAAGEGSAPPRQEEAARKSRELAERLAEKMIADAGREAADIKARAEELLNKAIQDSEMIKAEAKALGYEEGKARAESDYVEFIRKNDEALSRVLAEVERGRAEMFKGMEAEVIDLCFAVIKKIAAMDRARDGELFRSIIKKTLNQMEASGRFTIRVSSEDLERFFPGGEAVFTVGDSQVTVTVADDPGLRGGDIIIENDSETVTAGADTQIKNIEIAFRHQLGKSDE